MKIIDLDQSIQSVVQLYPEVKDILFDLGFKDIIKPGMLQTVGRFMTIRKGMELKNIPLISVTSAFTLKGYLIKEEK